jgi:hypothetical protein
MEFAFSTRAVKMQHQSPHRIGGAPAIIEQVFVALVARRHHILLEGRQQIAERLQRQGPLADGSRQCLKHGAGRLCARFNHVQALVIFFKRG